MIICLHLHHRSQVVRAFARRNLSETELFSYACVMLSHGASVLLSDIDIVYICYRDSSDTSNFLYDMDVELEHSDPYFISHPYIMLKVNTDVNSIFINPGFHNCSALWAQQLMFLPTLFKVCTPSKHFVNIFPN